MKIKKRPKDILTLMCFLSVSINDCVVACVNVRVVNLCVNPFPSVLAPLLLCCSVCVCVCARQQGVSQVRPDTIFNCYLL